MFLWLRVSRECDTVPETLIGTNGDSMYLTLGQAAKQSGIGKATLSRYIKQGKISGKKQEDGSYRIDAAELDRLPDIMRPRVEQPTERITTHMEPRGLEREIDLLREMLSQKDKTIEDLIGERDKWSRMAESLQEEKQKLLTNGRSQGKSGVWAWLLGKS
jgi:excisionase family DNA binding protein